MYSIELSQDYTNQNALLFFLFFYDNDLIWEKTFLKISLCKIKDTVEPV